MPKDKFALSKKHEYLIDKISEMKLLQREHSKKILEKKYLKRQG